MLERVEVGRGREGGSGDEEEWKGGRVERRGSVEEGRKVGVERRGVERRGSVQEGRRWKEGCREEGEGGEEGGMERKRNELEAVWE